jgi:hypothetical protein
VIAPGARNRRRRRRGSDIANRHFPAYDDQATPHDHGWQEPARRRVEYRLVVVKRAPQQVRHYTVRGHVIRVFPSGQDQWGVTVNGVELRDRFSRSFDAWAAGVEESYRRDPGPEPRTLSEVADRAAAREHLEPPGARRRRR